MQDPSLNIDLHKVTPSQILLYLGGLIVVIAAITYIGINWSEWNSYIRILVIFTPMVILFSVGIPLWRTGNYEKQALAFIFTGSLIFPLWLVVTFKELHLMGDPVETLFQFTVAFLSLILYIILRFLFPSAIWVFLYCAEGVISWFLLLRLLHIGDPPYTSIIWWLMLPLVGVYSYIGSLLERKGKRDFGKYAYSVAVLLFITSLYILTANGDLLKPLVGQIDNLSRWSEIASGVIFLFISWVLEKSKSFNLEEPQKYVGLFNLLGVFNILASVFILGLNGNKPIYETSQLILSLFFIFASIPKVSRSFLYVGTLYLAIYIFAIGGEYFQDQVGWPLTLFAVGLLTMAAGFGVEKIRRKYFGSKIL